MFGCGGSQPLIPNIHGVDPAVPTGVPRPRADLPCVAKQDPCNDPAGDAPFSVTFIGRSRTDADLIGIAYAYEQASQLRVPPILADATARCAPVRQGQRGGGSTSWWGLSPA